MWSYSGLDDVLGIGLAPGDGSGVPLLVNSDLVAVDNQVTSLLAGTSFSVGLDGDVALESSVDGVILEHVDLSFREAYHVKGTALERRI